MNKKIDTYVEVIDTVSPEIVGAKDITINVNDDIDLLENIEVTDNSKENILVEVIGDYNTKKAGTYELSYQAKDASGNITNENFNLIVKEKIVTNNNNNSKYYIKVNKTQNVAIVYSLDEKGEYTNIVKNFVISAGEGTPVGTFKTTDRYETLSLVGGVWGRYTMRIVGAIWFHSVPYFSKPTKDNPHWDNLEYEEYNKLGTLASLGCIRLATIDAKWIYENIPWHTTVEIYESDDLPDDVTKPTSITIDVTSENKGWDPTDHDLENP